MKKTLFFLTFAFIFVIANAQCIPDPQFTAAGIYPDTATGLADGYVGQSYIQNITIITPTDTVVDIGFGGPISVDIDSISITSVTGLPYGFDYSCDPPSCGFPGGTVRCAEVYSTILPDDSLIRRHNIVFEITSFASGVPVLGLFQQQDVIDYYFIDILDNTTFTVNNYNKNTFELMDVYPNPSVNNVKIQFISGEPESILFRVYNLLGKEIESLLIKSNKGVNTINLPISSYKNGIYLYSVSNGNNIQTKRMLVNN